jgi:SPP1 family predicted phage head-tail adaptor
VLQAGRLRHWVALERKQQAQDAAGDITESWVAVADRLPAEIAPLSAKEFMAAQAMRSAVDARITIRWRAGVTGAMRFRNLEDGTVYNIAGAIADNQSGREWLTVPVSSGVNNG